MTESSANVSLPSGPLVAYPIRLTPGQDLVPALEEFAGKAMEQSNASASFVLSAVGSLDYVKLRMANACRQDVDDSSSTTTMSVFKEWEERLEVISLVGTFSPSGKHLHMSVSDGQGAVYGGHLIAAKVFTTLELVLGVIQGVDFSRSLDSRTGYTELVVASQSVHNTFDQD
mmetsp:Transcript_7078/g.13092  ORF Transcript_7078/g.13092 Transcript_7078/m.13092 type:complete len:172 (-) Transcript_7078:1300-1815(-)